MSKLANDLAQFDKNDVKAMDEARAKFDNFKKENKSGLPDYSPGFVAYTPILSFALLKSQAAMEKLTRWIIVLTVVLVVLAGIQMWLILK